MPSGQKLLYSGPEMGEAKVCSVQWGPWQNEIAKFIKKWTDLV